LDSAVDDKLRDAMSRWSKLDFAVVFAAALAFYTLTLAPTVVWGDSATLSLRAFQGPVRLSTASDHPLFLLIAHAFAAFPGDVGRNVNLVSALFGALTVALVYRCGRQLGASRLAAAVGGAALCVSHAFWLHSVIAEVYTANAFFLAATVTLLLDWRTHRHPAWLAAASAVFGVGLTNHLALLSAAPAAVAFVHMISGRKLLSLRSLVWIAALAGAGCLALLVFPSFAAVLRSFWVGPPGLSEYFEWPDPSLLPQEIGYYVLFLVYQFPTVSLALGAVGLVVLLRRQPALAVLLAGIVVVNAGIFIRHTIWPSAASAKYVFYIADYVVFSILCALGTEAALQWSSERKPHRVLAWGLTSFALAAFVPPAIYAATPWAVRTLGFDLIRASDLPYRDSDRFYLNPNKRGNDGARRFGEEALEAVESGAVIFADYTPHAVLLYLQVVEGRRPDVILQSARSFGQTVPVRWISNHGRQRPTYLATLTPGYYDFGGLTGHYEVVPAGPIFQVLPR
jgi:hypothetical protein